MTADNYGHHAAPEQVLTNLSSVEIDDGFLNRFVIVQASLPPMAEKDIFDLPVLDEHKEWVKSIRQRPVDGKSLAGQNTDYDQAPVPVSVAFSPAAKALFDQFKQEIKAKELAQEYVEPKLVKRWRENAMRMQRHWRYVTTRKSL